MKPRVSVLGAVEAWKAVCKKMATAANSFMLRSWRAEDR